MRTMMTLLMLKVQSRSVIREENDIFRLKFFPGGNFYPGKGISCFSSNPTSGQ